MDTIQSANPAYTYTRKEHEAVQSRYRGRLVLLEGPEAYWTYFHDARTISAIMNWHVYENRRSVPGITFPKDQLETVLQALDQNHVNWIVCSPSGERLSAITEASIRTVLPEEEPGDL